MPIYEYECKECGEKFEQFRKLSGDDSEVKCSRCGAKGPRRVFSTFATTHSNDSSSPTGST